MASASVSLSSKYRSPRADNVFLTKQSDVKITDNKVLNGDVERLSLKVPTISHCNDAAIQNYERLRDYLFHSGTLFEDTDFVPSDNVLFPRKPMSFKIEWKRPREICRKPFFFKDGVERFDVRQGELGNCWLLASLACLTQYPELVHRVVPSDQGFEAENKYCGLFRFSFWHYGEWKQVLVDDRLPTYHRGKLVFMQSDAADEFWSALLEKAYAKLMGSYEVLAGGWMSEAMEDFTGGLVLTHELQSPKTNPKEVFDRITKAQQHKSLMGCSIQANPNEVEKPLTNGLIMGHAYSITDIKLVNITISGGKKGKLQLIRIRNPWGDEHEWNGPWSDKSKEWTLLNEEERTRLGLVFNDDGEFWMPFSEFMKNFTHLEICYLSPQSAELASSKVQWQMFTEQGEWRKNMNAGGCRNFLDTFSTNPQYRVTVIDTDDEDGATTGTLIVGLMQKDRRNAAKNVTLENLIIGYVIYRLDDKSSSERLDKRFFATHRTCAIGTFVNQREVSNVHRLEPGNYVIVPSTFEPNFEGEFVLRIIAEKTPSAAELDDVTQESTNEFSTVNGHISTSEDAKLFEHFKKIAGEDSEIDAFELRKILDLTYKKEFEFEGFSIDCAKSMVALMDLDMSGKLGFEEFKNLWMRLRVLKAVFVQHDVNSNGTINTFELREILKALGYTVSNKVLNSLVIRYGDEKGEICFDDYVILCIRLKHVCECYKALMSPPENIKRERTSFDRDVFLQCMMIV